MNHSFKLIVDPCNTERVEITSFLQYCALKNTLSKLTSNNIKPLDFNSNDVCFSYKVTDVDSDTSFTKYALMTQSEKYDFMDTLRECWDSSFFNAVSHCGDLHIFKSRRRYREVCVNDNNAVPDNFTVEDLCTIFMEYQTAKKYLAAYTPSNPEEICYAQIPKTTINDDTTISYDDGYMNFIIAGFNCKNENTKEYIKFVNCINEHIDFAMLHNCKRIANTYDDLCVYTEDPEITHKVLKNNQAIIDKMAEDIFYISLGLYGEQSYRHIIPNELQTSITNVVNTYETIVKEAGENLAALNKMIN